MKLFNITTKSTKRLESTSEAIQLVNEISNLLTSTDACKQTFQGRVIQDGLIITEIKNRTGQVRFTTVGDNVYGNRMLKLKKFEVRDLNLGSGAGSDKYGEFNLYMTIEKVSTLVSGESTSRDVVRSFPIKVSTDASDVFQKCFSHKEDSVESARKLICEEDAQGIFSAYCNWASWASWNGMSASRKNRTVMSTSLLEEYLLYKNPVVITNLQVLGEITMTSDLKLKREIQTLEGPLEKLTKIRGVRYKRKKDKKEDIGVIAQEVEEVYPSLVTTDEKTGMRGVKYMNFTPILIEAIKTLREENIILRKAFCDISSNHKICVGK